MKLQKPKKIKSEIDKLKDCKGDLVLLIGCTKCDSFFELNKEAIALAVITHTSLIDYIQFVQNSKCSLCNGAGL